MTDEEQDMVREIAYKGRKGMLTYDEQAWCETMFNKYPDEYRLFASEGRRIADAELRGWC